jgi:hypothetical protein
VYSTNTLIAITLIALIAGLAVGLLLNNRRGGSRANQQELENHLSELRQQQQDYQEEVTAHFNQTATLINQLTESYRNVHNHLAKGAQLLTQGDSQQAIRALPDDEGNYPEDSRPELNISPPLDYAPKTPDQQGVLSESFGIQKNKQEKIAEAPIGGPL